LLTTQDRARRLAAPLATDKETIALLVSP